MSVAAAIAVALAVPASAAPPSGSCNGDLSLCNTMYGKALKVDSVLGERYARLGNTGFFQVIGPHGFKRTGPTLTGELKHSFPINQSFSTGDLICVQFWAKNANGSFTQKGGNVCGTLPIR
ncbi:hypothetical protein OG474_37535 [Kribbella sp. NBC_01505]|uniref:hypothetical protein n=1 Tax=Kribbella sp. NBC_01505 TaxID=2903580 RepID=UPI003863D2CE